MNRFIIKFRGLSEEKYRFEADDTFFNQFKESEIKKGTVHFDVKMVFNKNLITLNISLKGNVFVECDRCLDYFYQKIKHKTILYVEFGYENSDITDVDNKIILSNKENEIVLDKHFYDYIHLSLPYQKVHPKHNNGNSGCNIEMINKMAEFSSVNNKKTDPRWDQLKNLFN
ncbi:MAG: DUF177 domain-containing protein [Bacteroidales bacterium]|nr:DUF177 domain-containing protein [Bacteroidales bacterium]